MKIIYSQPNTTGGYTFALPKGQYGAIAIEYDLDAAAAVTLTRANMGNIRLTWNGRDVVNVDSEMLNLVNNLYGGVAEFSSAVGGATRMTCFIPVGMWWDSQNVYDVGDNDQVIIQLSFPDLALAANVDSGSIRIHVKEKVGVMKYLHIVNQRFEQTSAAAVVSNSLPINNVSQLYYLNPAGALSQMQILKDGETIVDDTIPLIMAYNEWLHQLETAGTTLAIEFNESKELREVIGRQISYKHTFSGAATLRQYYSAVEFVSDAKVAQSMITAENKIKRNLNQLT